MTVLNRGPNLRIKVNKQLLHEAVDLQQNTTLELEFDPGDANQLTIEHWGKNPKHIPSGEDIAFEITAISFDGIELHRNLLYSSEFYPNWSWGDAPNVVENNCYIGYNGVWSLVFPRDPVTWMMDYIESEMFVQGTSYNHQSIGDDIGAQDLADFKRDFL